LREGGKVLGLRRDLMLKLLRRRDMLLRWLGRWTVLDFDVSNGRPLDRVVV
jgi:hypothetical protein